MLMEKSGVAVSNRERFRSIPRTSSRSSRNGFTATRRFSQGTGRADLRSGHALLPGFRPRADGAFSGTQQSVAGPDRGGRRGSLKHDREGGLPALFHLWPGGSKAADVQTARGNLSGQPAFQPAAPLLAGHWDEHAGTNQVGTEAGG